MTTSSTFDHILAAFRRDLAAGCPPHEALRAILAATSSRAVGLWRREGDLLTQMGFCAAADMPVSVRDAFAAATHRVPLDQTGLGIVKAVRSAAPALADIDSQTTVLSASAGWLARFEARRSLAVPTRSENTVNGVLAVSTAGDLVPDDSVWELMCRLAVSLGDLLAALP